MMQSFVLVSCLWGLQLHVEAFHASVGVRRDVRFQSSSFLPSLPSPRFNTISRVPSLWAAEAEDAEPKSTEEETTEPQPTEETIESSDSLENSAANSTSNAVETEKLNIFQRAMKYVRGNKENDGLTFRQRMAKMGLAVVLSYGWVSNMSYCVCMSIAWFIFAKQTGQSPLAPGQWKKFLAVYAGFYVFNNIVRPIRLAASVAVAPQFDKIVLWVQNKCNVKKGVAITLTVIVVNLIGTSALLAAMVSLAGALAGVPVLPPKATL